MIVRVVGCSHQTTPVEIRERVAFAPEQAAGALAELRRRDPKLEAVLLSTCNRVELYTATENGTMPAVAEQMEFLAACHGLDVNTLREYLYDHAGEEAVRHLFSVASSLESMVLGESQILSQVKQAYQQATEGGSAGPLLHATFQAASKTARRVASETALNQHRVSIPSVAVADFARAIFERFDDKSALVIGAGEMAEETLRYLRDEGIGRVTVVNRNAERGDELARRWEGNTLAWERLGEGLIEADLVICTTGSEHPIVTAGDFDRIESARQGRVLLVLDLAVPRDVEPSAGLKPWVYLYSIDDLRAACENNRRQRDKELPAARRIVDRETSRFMGDLHHRVTAPVIQRLRDGWDKPKDEELRRLFNKLPELDESSREEIRRAFDRLVNKLLHAPMASLRDESSHGIPRALLDALSKLFHLKD